MKLLTFLFISTIAILLVTETIQKTETQEKVHDCKKTSYQRGPGEPLSCPPTMDNEGICYDKCNSGENGVGFLCWKNGQARQRNMRPIFWCKPGYKKSNSLCYKACKKGFKGNGPVCSSTCGKKLEAKKTSKKR